MTSHRFHPQLHERINTVAALFPGSKVELLVLDEGTVMIECLHGTCHCSALLDDEGRRALIVALGGVPMDSAMAMVADLETEAEAQEDAALAELGAHTHVVLGHVEAATANLEAEVGSLAEMATYNWSPSMHDQVARIRAAMAELTAGPTAD